MMMTSTSANLYTHDASMDRSTTSHASRSSELRRCASGNGYYTDKICRAHAHSGTKRSIATSAGA